jgi:ABC-type antimicrobial peptide transport system permease subunit
MLIAVGLAVLGGLLAGAIGGWRASRLRPAEALRSVA